jgi:hypothetical protein
VSYICISELPRSSAPALHCSRRGTTRADPPGVSAEVLASRGVTAPGRLAPVPSPLTQTPLIQPSYIQTELGKLRPLLHQVPSLPHGSAACAVLQPPALAVGTRLWVWGHCTCSARGSAIAAPYLDLGVVDSVADQLDAMHHVLPSTKHQG